MLQDTTRTTGLYAELASIDAALIYVLKYPVSSRFGLKRSTHGSFLSDVRLWKDFPPSRSIQKPSKQMQKEQESPFHRLGKGQGSLCHQKVTTVQRLEDGTTVFARGGPSDRN
jgi:hypothetical protein